MGGNAELALQLSDVSKTFGGPTSRVSALDGVSFAVPSGQVTAVVGHNGAGKTTLLRLIAGLARPDRGRIEVWGQPVPAAFELACRDMGCLIEGSGFIGGLSGLANLDLLARRHGLGGRPVARLLRECGLSDQAALRTVGSYSLGMRQRLGLAVAMLGEPRLLVLDEPTNGLDPAGIGWMRGVLRRHTASGGAAVVSSHQLDEVERVADNVVMLAHGRVGRAGGLRDLLRDATARVRLRVTGTSEAAASTLRHGAIPVEIDGNELIIEVPHRQLGAITPMLAAANIGVLQMVPTTSHLEVVLRDLEQGP
jgi:ABC-2 type transport system ATP-binding protein